MTKAHALTLGDPTLVAAVATAAAGGDIFDNPDTQFTDSFEATDGWTGIVIPALDFDDPDSQFTDSFETSSGWT